MLFLTRKLGILFVQEPYHDPDTVTDELVDVLLSPLLTEGCGSGMCSFKKILRHILLDNGPTKTKHSTCW